MLALYRDCRKNESAVNLNFCLSNTGSGEECGEAAVLVSFYLYIKRPLGPPTFSPGIPSHFCLQNTAC